MNNMEIGTVLSEEVQVKKWPTKTIAVSLIITLYMLYFAFAHSRFITLAFVLVYWCFFFLFNMYNFSRKRIVRFGTKGAVREYHKGATVEEAIDLYADIDKPQFHVTEFKVNGMHTNYAFSVSFGTIVFSYSYDYKNEPLNDFDYICAHKMYKYWSHYKLGEERDFQEKDRIALGELANLMK